jgi:YHS domain-containing protein
MNNKEESLKTCCGGDLPERIVTTNHNGKKLYFCDTACLNLFNKNPERFLSSTHFRLDFEELEDAN